MLGEIESDDTRGRVQVSRAVRAGLILHTIHISD